jgi:hypothetical protein
MPEPSPRSFPLPTDLPGSKPKRPPQTKTITTPKHPVFSKVLRAFMVGSVLLLFAIVLLQEKHYASGESGTVADGFFQKAQAILTDDGADSATVAPN